MYPRSSCRCTVYFLCQYPHARPTNPALLHERLFSNATTPFMPVRGLDYDLQHLSLLSEAVNAVVHCITVLRIKRQDN